jgi:hypothetical protein
MKKNILILFVSMVLFATLSCSKSEQSNLPTTPVITGSTPSLGSTIDVDFIGPTSAISGGEVLGYEHPVTASGVCWSTSPMPTIKDDLTNDPVKTPTGVGKFYSKLTNLKPSTVYYLRSYATNIIGTSYGNQVTFTTLATGQTFLGDINYGGVVFYILVKGDPGYDANKQHGFVAAIDDQSTGIRWSNGSSILTGASGELLGTGLSNTNTIIKVQGAVASSYAAGIAKFYTGGGFNDWHLPSFDELTKLYINRYYVRSKWSGTYWSSSESSSGYARFHILEDGNTRTYGTQSKDTKNFVCAIRAF